LCALVLLSSFSIFEILKLFEFSYVSCSGFSISVQKLLVQNGNRCLMLWVICFCLTEEILKMLVHVWYFDFNI
jgi:hypothetical protein